MNIAIQVGGELRNWETSHTLFTIYLKILEKSGIKADLYGTFWQSPYTDQCNRGGYFDIFTDMKILPVPTVGVTEGYKKSMVENNTGLSLNLYNWSYACYYSSKIRREYTWGKKPFGFKYDFVAFTRPDVYIPYTYWKFLEVLLKVKKKALYPYSMLVPPIAKIITDLNNLPPWPHYYAEDVKIAGDEDGMNLFSMGVLPLYIDKNPSFVATYHNTPALTIAKFNLGVVPTSETFKSDWQILRKNDGLNVSEKQRIEEEYLAYEEFTTLKEKLNIE